MAAAEPRFLTVLRLEELPPGQARKVTVEGREIAVFNVDGKLYAIDDTCTHEKASLSKGELDGAVVACPRHGARFDLASGRALTLPAFRPVKTYPVRLHGEEVQVGV